MFIKKTNPDWVVCQVYRYISQISGERLQEYWSSGWICFDPLTKRTLIIISNRDFNLASHRKMVLICEQKI